MEIIYFVLVCLGVFLDVLLFSYFASIWKKRKKEKGAESYEKFATFEEQRQAEVREIMKKNSK
jgi:hypothetical protein